MWRRQSTAVAPCAPTLGKPKPPPTIPFQKQNDGSLPPPEPKQSEPAPVHDPPAIDRGTIDSSEIDVEVFNWIKENPDVIQKLHNFLNK